MSNNILKEERQIAAEVEKQEEMVQECVDTEMRFGEEIMTEEQRANEQRAKMAQEANEQRANIMTEGLQIKEGVTDLGHKQDVMVQQLTESRVSIRCSSSMDVGRSSSKDTP